MLTALYSGITGLQAHQTYLDVTGNNIANLNTLGFKSSRVRFADLLSQNLTNAAAGNPAQVGLGVRAAAVDKNFSQGSLLQTGNIYDLAIGGEGFFVLNDGSQDYYSRAGAFSTDVNGNLVDSVTGYNVKGYAITNGTKATSLSSIQIPFDDTITLETSKVNVSGDLLAASGSGSHSTTASVLDSGLTSQSLTLDFAETSTANTWDLTLTDGGSTTYGTISGITFDSGTGDISTPTSASITADFGSGDQTITFDFSALTEVSSGSSTASAAAVDNYASFKSVSIDTDGVFNALYTNGDSKQFAQIERVTFNNPNGLEQTGDNLYQSNINVTGSPTSVVSSGAGGNVISGTLENSNVDITRELTNLIIAQRGFQANSRTVTTSNQVLMEIMQVV